MKVPTGSSVSSWQRVPGIRSLERRGGSGIGCSRSLPMAVRLRLSVTGCPASPTCMWRRSRVASLGAGPTGTPASAVSAGRRTAARSCTRLPKLPGLITQLFRIPADGDRLERGTRALHTSVAGLSMSRPRSGQARPNRVHQESHRCRSSPRRSRGSTGRRRLSEHRPLFRLHARGRSGPVLAGRETGRLPVR